MAVSAIAGGVAQQVNSLPWGDSYATMEYMTRGMAAGVTSAVVRGQSLSKNVGNIALDVVGATIGNQIAAGLGDVSANQAKLQAQSQPVYLAAGEGEDSQAALYEAWRAAVAQNAGEVRYLDEQRHLLVEVSASPSVDRLSEQFGGAALGAAQSAVEALASVRTLEAGARLLAVPDAVRNAPGLSPWDGRSGSVSATQVHPFYGSVQERLAISMQDGIGLVGGPSAIGAKAAALLGGTIKEARALAVKSIGARSAGSISDVANAAKPGLSAAESAAVRGTTTVEARGGTYVLRDADGTVVRTGRTNNLARREAEHLRDSDLAEYRFEPAYRTDVYAEQRGLEQILHDQYSPVLNKIRPISPSNAKLPTYMDAAQKYLIEHGGL